MPPLFCAPPAVDVFWLLLVVPPTLELPPDVAGLVAELPAVLAAPPLLDAPPVLLATLEFPPVVLLALVPPLEVEPPAPVSEFFPSGSPLEHAIVQGVARHKNSHAEPREQMRFCSLGAAVILVV
jgi:hypothetical protein